MLKKKKKKKKKKDRWTAGMIQEYLTVLHIMVTVNQIAEKFM